MFRQVVSELVKGGKVDITSCYESLRGQDVVGDFQFVILNKTRPYQHLLRGWKRLVLRAPGALRWLGVSEQESFGLDNSAFMVENVPLPMPAPSCTSSANSPRPGPPNDLPGHRL